MTHEHNVVSREQWLKDRKSHLQEEKEFSRLRDRLARTRRELPWVKVDQNYLFDGPNGSVSLADLFDGRSQLLIYHFMFAPDWSQGCKSCSLLADHYAPAIVHLHHRDTSMVTVSRAPIEKLLAFQKRMGWDFPWVSSGQNSFNHDYGVWFSDEERENGLAIYNYDSPPFPVSDLPGLSAFTRTETGEIYHTYSTYARGLDLFLNVYNLLDVTPKGRDEEGISGMSWVRHHDRYDVPGYVEPWMEKVPAATDSGK